MDVPIVKETLLQPTEWTRILAKYREPNHTQSVFEVAITLAPFIVIWALAWLSLSISPWLALALAVANSTFLVRLFMIQHDCGHGAFFKNRKVGDWVGRCIGVLTLTPYDVWRRNHAMHHATTGNLDHRGTGDLPTLTVREYRAKSWIGRMGYRLVRNPLFLFGVVPFYTFFLQNRLPIGVMRGGRRYWISAQGTNLAVAAIVGGLLWLGGLNVVLFIFLPTVFLAAVIGMWLFYIQHQFEDTVWDRDGDWTVQDAALHGSSHYDLPRPLRWLTGNIGVHHVHHLASRIPFYRLPEVMRDHDVLAQSQRITLWESFKCARLHLWDEDSRKLLSFAAARRLAA
ncbi:fatty acid desaturase [Gymnodinialimonas ceratoperidinii]|uniref:Fatty acid desaturase n=1 Tax=Gymnodinialimonas ceratoperidinii TaxID=2856823 RepID=A0A8F6TWC0_9RHOB|nr:fatty acid desaturase [Gymnodinialimonas ceratoperidinii]QXT38942.1 fatty acid desaturase [Gymnodinialimonas ceratoperidinii]